MRYQLRIYYASPERAALDPDPARHLDPERIETTLLQTALPH